MAEIVKPGVLFKKGLVGNLKPLMASGGSEGTFYLAEDERSLYFGTKSGKIERIQGSVLYFDTLAQFTAGTQPPYSTDIIYFIASDNALVRWDGAKWIQLNATADAVNTAISDLTTAINGLGETVAQHTEDIADNAEAIATKAAQADLEALAARVTTNEGNIATNTSNIAKNTAAIATKAAQTDLDAANEAIGANTQNIAKNTAAIATKASQADFNDLKGRVDEAEDLIAENAEAIATKASQADFNTLEGRVSANEEGIEANGKAISETKTALNDYKTSNNTRVGAVESRMTQAETDIDNLEKNKADVVDFNGLVQRVDGIDESVSTNATNIATNATNITNLQKAVATKADNTEFQGVAQRVTTAEGNIAKNLNSINDLSANKADKSELATTNESVAANAEAITNLQTAVGKKANQTDLDNLTAVVDTKATKTSVENLTKKVNTNTANITDHTTRLNGIDETLETKVDKVAGHSLVADSEITKLAGIEAGANRTEVDAALSTTSTNPVQNKVISTKIDAMSTTITNNYNSLSEAVENLDEVKADKTAVDTIKKNLEDAIEEIADAIGVGGGTSGTTLSGRVAALEETAADHETRIGGAETRLNGIDEAIQTINDTKATKTELNTAKSDLTALINKEIDAANAMTYKNGVSAASQLPTSNVAVGDTYVVTEGFGGYNAGDLLVASGTEENGVIKGTITWTHVQTGYSTTFDQTLEVEDANGTSAVAINLKSHAGVVGTSVAMASANEGLTIDVVDDVITFNMVWGSF
jgi:hypothetical protein